MSFVNASFEANDSKAVAAGVAGDEISLISQVPQLEQVPDKTLGVTEAGNPSLRKATKSDRHALYKTIVAGYIIVTVKEAFAMAPSIQRVRIVAGRRTPEDAYGRTLIEPLVAAWFTRTNLNGIRWEQTTAIQILNDASDELIVAEKGTIKELIPIDLKKHPKLTDLAHSASLNEIS